MISIIVLAHDRDKNLEYTLDCWKNQTFKDFELNVFESANMDSTIDILKRYKNDFKINCWRQHVKYVDKTKAINFLAQNSNYDILSVWDVDLIKAPTYLETCLKLLKENNFVENYARYVNTAFTKKIFDEKLTYDQITYWDDQFPTCFNRADAPSQICLYKKDFLAIGGYDERFFGWGPEDSDCFRRLRRSGKDFVIADPCCYHLEHSTKNNYTSNPFTVKSNNYRIAQENDEVNRVYIDNSGMNVYRPENLWNPQSKPEKIEI
jgi:hypothetical protein